MYLTKQKRSDIKGSIAWLEQKIRMTDQDYHHEILEPEIVLNFLKGIINDL